MPVVRTHGVEVAYVQVGEGPPIVLAHGAASDGRMWRPQLDALADEFTVIAWDEPGAGRSSQPPPGFGVSEFADCLAAVIESVGLSPAHVGGLSWGGSVALELFRVRSDLVATLILADSYAGWKGSLPDSERRDRIEGVESILDASEKEFDPTFPGLFAAEPPAQFASLLEAIDADVRRESLRTLLGAMGDLDQRDLLPAITVPTLLIWGELDARSPLRVARQFDETIPDARLVVIPDAGHMSNLEQPERFNRAVREFCRSHGP